MLSKGATIYDFLPFGGDLKQYRVSRQTAKAFRDLLKAGQVPTWVIGTVGPLLDEIRELTEG